MIRRTIGLLVFLLVAIAVWSQGSTERYRDSLFAEVGKASFIYATIDGEALGVDIYQAEGDIATRRPIILYVHGGGFSGGVRDGANLVDWASYFARRGYVVASMSYRLTMRGKSFDCDQPAVNKVRTFQQAASDIRACTAWLLGRADSLRVDPERIVLAGSSAGAEAILHAGYWPASEFPEARAALPAGFRYAGLISMAGALVDTSLIQAANAVPVQLFHGTCDRLVPYGTAPHHYCPENTPGALRLHGAASIAGRYRQLGASYQLITVCNGGHGWAVRPMIQEREQTLDWMYREVLAGWRRQVELAREQGNPCALGVEPVLCGPRGF